MPLSANECQKLIINLKESYNACKRKGALIPDKQCFDNLATCISSINQGGNSTTIKNYVQGSIQSSVTEGVVVKDQIQGTITSDVTTDINYSTYWKPNGILTEVSEGTYIGFSNSSYLEYLAQSNIIPLNKSYTLYLTIETGNDVITHQSLIGTQQGDDKFAIGIGDGKFYLIDKKSGVPESNCTVSGCIVKANTKYDITVLFLQGQHTITLAYSYSGTSQIIDTLVSTQTQPLSLVVGQGYREDSEWLGFLGSISTTDSKVL